MEHATVERATAALEEIEKKFSTFNTTINARPNDLRRWTISFPDGSKKGYLPFMNRRAKAFRDWIREWGSTLESLGYRVHKEQILYKEFRLQIEESPSNNDNDDVTAQIEKEKSKTFFDPKRR